MLYPKLRISPKELQGILGKLREDKLVCSKTLATPGVAQTIAVGQGKFTVPVAKANWYIDFPKLVDAVKYRLYMMKDRLEKTVMDVCFCLITLPITYSPTMQVESD